MTMIDRVQILKSAVADMAQFIRENPPAAIPEKESMPMKDFCCCFVDAESDPTGQKIMKYFVTNSYKKYMGKEDSK